MGPRIHIVLHFFLYVVYKSYNHYCLLHRVDRSSDLDNCRKRTTGTVIIDLYNPHRSFHQYGTCSYTTYLNSAIVYYDISLSLSTST